MTDACAAHIVFPPEAYIATTVIVIASLIYHLCDMVKEYRIEKDRENGQHEH